MRCCSRTGLATVTLVVRGAFAAKVQGRARWFGSFLRDVAVSKRVLCPCGAGRCSSCAHGRCPTGSVRRVRSRSSARCCVFFCHFLDHLWSRLIFFSFFFFFLPRIREEGQSNNIGAWVSGTADTFCVTWCGETQYLCRGNSRNSLFSSHVTIAGRGYRIAVIVAPVPLCSHARARGVFLLD